MKAAIENPSQVAPEPPAEIPAPMEMERLVAPPILSNLTMAGAVLVKGESGLLCSPVGMVTTKKMIQACCCPDSVQLALAYTNGSYTNGIQIDSHPVSCCGGAPHWTISKKDYTTPADEKEAGPISRQAINKLRSKGKSDAFIAKLYPKKEVLAKTVAEKRGCCSSKPWGIVVADQPGFAFVVKNKPVGCRGCFECPTCDACSNGVLEGRFAMNFKNPIYNHEGVKVAYVVQTVPLIPTSCCTADAGPTLQMAIHKHPSYDAELSEDDISRLALFMFTVKPNVPNRNGTSGGPVNLVGRLANMVLVKTGWALGFGMTEVEKEYLTFEQVFNGEIASIGDLVDAIRGNSN